jgi:glutathione synthase/RimK-type ligase-like ATP-grasp enzyme
MKVGLLLNSHNKLFSYTGEYLKILELNNIMYRLIDPNSRTLLDDLRECTHLLFHHSQGDTDLRIYDTVYNIAHNIMGIKCLPDYNLYWQYEDKVKEYYMLKCHNFPVVDSCVFWNKEYADEYIKKAIFPIIVKLPKGSASTNVVLVKTPEEARKINHQVFVRGVRQARLKSRTNLGSVWKTGLFKYGKTTLRSFLLDAGLIIDRSWFPEWQIQKDSIIYQKYMPGNSYDQRIMIIGNKAFGCLRYVRKNDFRASGSGMTDFDCSKVDLRVIQIAFAISKKFNFSGMGYDFLYDENNNPFISEMGYCYADYIIRDLPGYWDESLQWHEAKNVAQHYELQDFLHVHLKPIDYTDDHSSHSRKVKIEEGQLNRKKEEIKVQGHTLTR